MGKNYQEDICIFPNVITAWVTTGRRAGKRRASRLWFLGGGWWGNDYDDCAGVARRRRPRARTTLSTVANLGLPSGDRAL